jgi:hypothetical protein
MNQEIKKRWVDALRSGEYKQGRSYLGMNNQFCCLGVLCEIIYRDGKIDKRERDDGLVQYGVRRDSTSLPIEVQDLADIDDDPLIHYNNLPTMISNLNDIKKLQFPEIADLIEEQL